MYNSFKELDTFWAHTFCKDEEEHKQVGWTEFQDGLAHKLQIPEEELERFEPIFAKEAGIDGAKVPFITKDRFIQLVFQYGLFFDQVCGKEVLKQVTILHNQLWFYDSMTTEKADVLLHNYPKQTFLVWFGNRCFRFASREEHKEFYDRSNGRKELRGPDEVMYRSVWEYVESLPPSNLTYVCQTTGRLRQLPIVRAWEKYVTKSELWNNYKKLGETAGVSKLLLQIIDIFPGKINVEIITALAETANLASMVTDCELPQKVYRHVMSAWLRAALYQVVNAACAALNFETTLNRHLANILLQAEVIKKILCNNTSNLEGLCSKIAEDFQQVIGQVAIIEQKFDGVIKLIQELLDAIKSGVLNEKDRLQVTSAMTTCLTAVTRVKHQWRITGDWIEVLKGDNAILLAQHESSEINNILDLAFFMNKSNAAILAIALCHRLSWDHLFLSLPILDLMLDLPSDPATHPRLKNDLKEKLDYYLSEMEILSNSITHEICETFELQKQ